VRPLTFIASLFAALSAVAAPLAFRSTHDHYAGKLAKLLVDAPVGERLEWGLYRSDAKIMGGGVQVPDSGVAELSLAFPAIATPANVVLRCAAAGATLEEPLRFYPATPFADQREFLKRLDIEVWAPDGRLPDLLRGLDVPFRPLDNLAGFDGRTLLVSGLDCDAFPGVGEELRALCHHGALVLLMPPLKGTLELGLNQADQIILDGDARILAFDKRLDARRWGDGPPAAGTLRLVGDGPSLRFDQAGGSKLTFCQATFGDGVLVATTWDIAGKGELSPSPVYLLNEIFARFQRMAKPGEPKP